MSTMNHDNYRGKLTPEDRDYIRLYLSKGLSVREAAKECDLPYGQVRGYAEWLEAAMPDLISPPPADEPAILIFDIETSPSLGWFWGGMWKTNIIELEQEWYMLSVAYKWFGQDEVGYFDLHSDSKWTGGSTDDGYVVKRLHRLLDQADVVIAHNGDRFDIIAANTRFLKHGLGPVSPFQSIDTLKESRRYFKRESHSLKYLGEKMSHSGLDLWFRFMAGDPTARAEMREYNMQDVVGLEDVYVELRPWMGTPGKKAHPNLGQWNTTDEPVCTNCGGRVIKRGKHRTKVSVYQTYQCKVCGSYSRARLSDRQMTDADKVFVV